MCAPLFLLQLTSANVIKMTLGRLIAALSWLLLATVAAQDSCTLETTFKDDDFPCRKLLRCRQPSSWASLISELQTKSNDHRLCAIVVDCAKTVTISNFDFQAINGRFDRVISVTISRCSTTQVRLADDMYYVVEVDLNGNSFDTLDFMQDWSGVSVEFEVLHFYRNRISSVRKDDFKEFYQLSNIRLDSNLIEDVESGSFHNNQRLQSVNFANNRIGSLTEDMFKDMKGLKIVQLSRNRISSLTAGVFVNVHLDSLDLSYNEIATVPNSIFADTSVISLNISNCRISNIPSGFLSSLQQNLTTLDLSNNDIDQIASDAFAHLSQMQVIYLTGSRLTTIVQSMFPASISEIHLNSKSLHCCNLLWLQILIKGTASKEDVECIYPIGAPLAHYDESSFDCGATTPSTSTQSITTTTQSTATPQATTRSTTPITTQVTTTRSTITIQTKTTAIPSTTTLSTTTRSTTTPPTTTTQKITTTTTSTIQTKTTAIPSTTTLSTTTRSTTTPPATTTQKLTTTSTTTHSTTPRAQSTTTKKTSTITPSESTTSITGPPPSPKQTRVRSLPTTSIPIAPPSTSTTQRTRNESTANTKPSPRQEASETKNVNWIIVASAIVAVVVVVVALVFMWHRRVVKRREGSGLPILILNNIPEEGDDPADDTGYAVIPADTTGVDDPAGNSRMASDDYQHLGAVGGQRDSHVYATMQAPKTAESAYVSLDNVGKSRGTTERESGQIDTANADKVMPPSAEQGQRNTRRQKLTDAPQTDTVYQSPRSRTTANASKDAASSVDERKSNRKSDASRKASANKYEDMPQRSETDAQPTDTYQSLARPPLSPSDPVYTHLC